MCTRHNCPHLEQPHCNPCRHRRDTTGRDHGNLGANEHHNTVNETTRLPSGTHGMQSHHQMTCRRAPPLGEDQTNVHCVAQEHHLLASPNRHPNCEKIATLSTKTSLPEKKISIVALRERVRALSQNGSASSIISRSLPFNCPLMRQGQRETNSGTSFRDHVSSTRGAGGKHIMKQCCTELGLSSLPSSHQGGRELSSRPKQTSSHVSHHMYRRTSWNMFVPQDTEHWRTASR